MFFWLLLVLLIIPGPRRVISTAVNRVVLNVKYPAVKKPENQIQLGEKDFNWMLEDLQGELVSLDIYRGSVIFLNFWATWCPPCVAELPEIQHAYEKHGNDVIFILVTNQQPEVVKAFLEKHEYDLPVYYAKSKSPVAFEASSIPTTYIISKEGKIVTKKTGAVNWDSRATTRIFSDLLR